MKVAGIDLSSHAIDIVKIDRYSYQGFRWTHVDLGKKGDAFDRARLVRARFGEAHGTRFWDDVIAVGIEEPFGRGQLSTAAGYRVQGAILACLPSGLLVQPWAPATWKYTIGIGGNADKQRIMEWAVKKNQQRGHVPKPTGIVLNSGPEQWVYPQDVADALGIAEATRLNLVDVEEDA